MDNKIIGSENKAYDEVKLLKQSEKGTIHIVKEKGGEQLFIRKILKGQYPVYLTLKNCPHPCLPRIYEVTLSDNSTTIIEDYIEGETPDNTELSKVQFLSIVKELCSVLDFLHKKEIIHRDIKPSNLILTKEGHIYLIDFDAARRMRKDLEQDTRLLGTRGYAPPEQYGFSQTDERTDIYALGITLSQLLGNSALNPRYKKIIQKCTDLNPDKRYQSVQQVEWAFFYRTQKIIYGFVILLLTLLLLPFWKKIPVRNVQPEDAHSSPQSEEQMTPTAPPEETNSQETQPQETQPELIVLPAPANPHWDGDTGIALWGCVLASGHDDRQKYSWRLFRRDTASAPDPYDADYKLEGYAEANIFTDEFQNNFSYKFQENGFYFFAVSATGDGETYTDSPFVVSDAFEFTGENAPSLPAPAGLSWVPSENSTDWIYACLDNLDDYDDLDSFHVTVYDKSGNVITNNRFTKEQIYSFGNPGIFIRTKFLADPDNTYRFTIQVYSSRPNEYSSFMLSAPIPEEYFSPWYSPQKAAEP